jgi:hypothetical protein
MMHNDASIILFLLIRKLIELAARNGPFNCVASSFLSCIALVISASGSPPSVRAEVEIGVMGIKPV